MDKKELEKALEECLDVMEESVDEREVCISFILKKYRPNWNPVVHRPPVYSYLRPGIDTWCKKVDPRAYADWFGFVPVIWIKDIGHIELDLDKLQIFVDADQYVEIKEYVIGLIEKLKSNTNG